MKAKYRSDRFTDSSARRIFSISITQSRLNYPYSRPSKPIKPNFFEVATF